jgi:flagellar hook-associated protein FlgK
MVLTCTVTAHGAVGITDGLSIEVRDESAELVATLNVGAGYAAGDRLEIADGLHATFAAGTLTAGEQFTVNALARSDSSGFLAAAGVNTLFNGNALLDMAVDDALLAQPGRLACAVGENMNDNTNLRRIADAGDLQLPALGGMSCADACRTVITHIAQRIQFAESRHSSLGSIIHQLLTQRDDISGVDVNDEAGKMLMFERMYQALAKLINTQQRALEALLEML